jgi:TolB protein
MKRIVQLLSIIIVFLVFHSNAQTPDRKLGDFDYFTIVGAPKVTGSAIYNDVEQTYNLTGAGSNIWAARDSFAFLSKKMTGDFIIQSQFSFIGKGNELHRKAGLMIRSSLDPNSTVVVSTVHGDGLTSLQYRTTNGGLMKEIKFKLTGPDVLQLEKKGNTYTMSVARFGEVYQVEKLDDIDLGPDLYTGLFICSHSNKFTEEATFTNTRVFNTAPDNLIQYKTYLGSLLEVMDVTTGKREIVSSSKGSIQAPNWAPNGKTLIYNESGKLYNFDLSTKSTSILNTDFANKNNNDHVLSFDGKQMGISHHDKENKGNSVVYTLPSNGGTPKKITNLSPSYFHGWSPNSKFLLFTGERNGDFDIYKISAKGGKEMQLTNTKGLDDGSEYSSDGKHIYFCSTRTGKMQVWRMNPDGGNQTQITFDEMNNWFPHVSPDNKWLAFISFSKDLPADQHPFYQRIYLRMIPIEGGKPKVISYVYGGQGTMNVPSWSPDSKKIAFVSNGNFNP